MKRFILAFTALVGIGVAAAVADYTATQGAGTTFGSAVQSTVHYAKWVLCDLTAPATQCATVSAAGAVKVDGSAVTQPVSGTITVTGTVTANAGTNLNTSALALDTTLATTNADLGAPGSTACATDNGSCNLNALAQRHNQRLTTINTTLGTPFQAGGSIGNTTFASTQSGTWTVQPGNTANTTPWLVTGSGGTFPVTATNLSTNINQINGVTPLMGNGVTGTGSPRVTIASDNTPFSVNATLAAETTKVIGTVNVAAGQSIVATQATAANLNATVVGTGTFATQAAQTGNWTVRNVGNAGGVLDFVGQNAASPANSFLIGGQFNTTPTTITTGNSSPLQLDTNGNLKVNVAVGGGTGGTSSTFGAAFPATGTAIGMTQGGNMVALSGTSGNLNVQCANCSGSGVSTVDEAAFTAATSIFAGTGGFFQTTATNNALTNGQQGMWQMTANRAGFVNLRNAAGAEIGVAAAPVQVSVANTAANGTAMLVTGTGGTFPVTGTVTANAGTNLNTSALALDATLTATRFAGQNATSSANSWLIGGQFNTTPTTITSGNSSPLQLDNAGNLKVNIIAGAASGAVAQGSTTAGQTGPLVQCAVTTAAPTYTTAQTDPLSCDTAGSLRTTVTNANVNGQATMANSSPVVIASNQTAVPVTMTSTTLTGTSAVNTSQINGVTPLMDNGATGTGAQRIVIANNATLPTGWASSVAIASTTAGQTGPLSQCAVTTAAPTYTTAQTDPLSCDTAGGLRVNPGTVTVTATNLSTNVAQINGVAPLMGNGVTGTGSQRVTIASDNTAFAVNSTLSAETTKVIGTVRNLGNAGAVTDFAGQNAASPANSWLIGGQFNTTPTTITSGNASPLQLDNAGNLLVNIKAGAASGAVAQGSTTAGQTGPLIQGAVTTAAPTYTTAQTSPISLDTSGNVRVSATGIAIASTTAGQTGSLVMCGVTTASPTYTTAQSDPLSCDTAGGLRVAGHATPTIANGSGQVIAPSAEALAAIAPVVSAALESNHVIKASAGNLYSAYITTGAIAGWFLVANSTTAPTAGGAAIAPIACVVAPANQTTSIGGTIPIRASTGITLVFSTSGCLTNTASTTAFFSGLAN